MSIQEDYVSFEIAKLLKEKGFDEESYKFYRHVFYNNEISLENCRTANEDCTLEFGSDTMTNKTLEPDFWSGTQEAIIAPTLQMAMKWLRNTFRLEIYPFHDAIQENNDWWYRIEHHSKGCSLTKYESDAIYKTYEQACEAAIKYCLENLI